MVIDGKYTHAHDRRFRHDCNKEFAVNNSCLGSVGLGQGTNVTRTLGAIRTIFVKATTLDLRADYMEAGGSRRNGGIGRNRYSRQ